MKRFEFIITAALLIGASFAKAQDPTTTQPALPPGHPDISAMNAGVAAPCSIRMRHIMVESNATGVVVTDMLAVQSNGADKNTILSVRLPPSASDVRAGEGFGDEAKFEDGKVIAAIAIPAGVSKYRLQYTLPFVEGLAQLVAVAPAPVQNMIVFCPNDGRSLTATGLEGPQTVDMGNGPVRFFRAADLASGAEVKLLIGASQFSTAEPATAQSAAETEKSTTPLVAPAQGFDSAAMAKAIGGVGALLVLLLGGALLMIKPQPKRNSKRS